MANQRALLLIADISGYTRFMKVHRINLSHAQEMVARLLEAVIDGASPRFKLSKLEGDAGLFYAKLPSNGSTDLPDLEKQLAAIRESFVAEREQLDIDRLCTCDGCAQVRNLKLKFVCHAGEIAFQKVKSFTELAGLDVILVHRMLKNSVPLTEYVLMTDAVLGGASEAVRQRAQSIEEDYEGVGATRVHYVDLDAIAPAPPPKLEPSFFRAWWGRIKTNWRSLPYMIGMKTPCDAFRNMDDALGLLPPPSSAPSETPSPRS
jgi:hypothetical protein